ncbi:hypothetical protein OG426_21000 [Streptomyces canus]|uniref:hypothetical protein n=1 Tax=Streptomyces canus TaxID=58343 RepID=UPI00386AB61B|nr:hypothetical protein OG426_21000 [Streptomyces canus]
MDRRPSDAEILEAVEAYARRRGVPDRPTGPGAEALTWQVLLDFRIVRSVETRGERPMREPGSRDDIASRPTYTDIDSHRVPPPDDPELSRSRLLVLGGSLGEERCADCDGGTNRCGTCGGRGVRDCPRFVDCPVCEGGHVECTASSGTKRVTHQECQGTGRFTVWTEGWIHQNRSCGLSRIESAQPHAPNGLGRTGPRRTQPRGSDTDPVRGPISGGPRGRRPLWTLPCATWPDGHGQSRRGGPEPSLWWSGGPARWRRTRSQVARSP